MHSCRIRRKVWKYLEQKLKNCQFFDGQFFKFFIETKIKNLPFSFASKSVMHITIT